jgi:putative MATE family efflux protein
MPEQRPSRLSTFIAAPRRAIWTLSLPMMAGMMVHTAYVIVDNAFIGWVSEHALAGVTFVLPLFFILLAVVYGVGTAITALVAQALGRKDHSEADRVASSSLSLAAVIGVVLTIGGLLIGPSLLRLLGAKSASWNEAWQYFRILVFSVPLFFIGVSLRSVLTAEGDARTPMIILTLGTLLNVGLDALFIPILGLGIRGAAWATVLAQTTSVLALAYIQLVRRRTTVRFRVEHMGIHRPMIKGLWTIGLPTAAGQLVMALGTALINRVIAKFGQIAVAAYGAASKVDLIVIMPIVGLAGGSVTVIGMFAGAGRADLIRSTALYTYRWAIALALIVGVSAYLTSDSIIRIFIDRAEALAIGRSYLGFMLFIYPLVAFGMTSGRFLLGLGHGLPALVITSVRVLVVSIPMAFSAPPSRPSGPRCSPAAFAQISWRSSGSARCCGEEIPHPVRELARPTPRRDTPRGTVMVFSAIPLYTPQRRPDDPHDISKSHVPNESI